MRIANPSRAGMMWIASLAALFVVYQFWHWEVERMQRRQQ